MNWKIDYCENCGKKKMLKNECMNCGLTICNDCYCEQVNCCINCADEEIKIQQNN